MGRISFRCEFGNINFYDEFGRIKYFEKHRDFGSRDYDFFFGPTGKHLGTVRRVNGFFERYKYEIYCEGVFKGVVERTTSFETRKELLYSKWKTCLDFNGWYCVIFDGSRVVATISEVIHFWYREYFVNVEKFEDEPLAIMIASAMITIDEAARSTRRVIIYCH